MPQRLVADGEPVVDVPAKLSTRARVFSTGQGRKTDATDAHSAAAWPYAPPTCASSGSMARHWRCACWPTGATNSAPPGR